MPLSNVQQYINLVLGYAYLGNVTPSDWKPTNWVHTDSIAPKVGKLAAIPTNVQPRNNAVCRECDAPAYLHPVKDQYLSCYRRPESIGQDSPDYGLNYREDYDQYGMPYRRYEGAGVNADGDQWDAIDYVSPDAEEEALARWKDNDPDAMTHALDYWYVTPEFIKSGTYTEAAKQRTPQNYNSEPDTRNAYVEGFDGFIALRLIDEYLTSKHHEHTLNVYRDKANNLRCGGILISVTVDGHIEAKCVNRNCPGRDTVLIDDSLTRERMEDFVYGIIAHGNNHAAYWYTSRVTSLEPKRINDTTEFIADYSRMQEVVRYDEEDGTPYLIDIPTYNSQRREDVVTAPSSANPTWYKVHAQDCADVSKCNQMKVAYCPVKTGTKSEVLTDSEVVKFLMEHNDVCRDAKCKCDEVLIDLVPALAHL